MTEALERLARLIRERNRIDAEIASIIGRPSLQGHIGEYIAAAIFDLELNSSATIAGFDARFRTGPLAGKTENIKCYGKREGILDMNERHVPDFYLVLTGPLSKVLTSRGGTRPFLIDEVFLFEATKLLEVQRKRGVKLGVASSVPKELWERARVFPAHPLATIPLSAATCNLVAQFSSKRPEKD